MDPHQSTCNLTCGSENVAHVVEEDERQIVANKGERDWRSAYFQVVHEQALAANRISGLQVARTRLVDGKATQRIASSSKEQLRQRHGCRLRRQGRSLRWGA